MRFSKDGIPTAEEIAVATKVWENGDKKTMDKVIRAKTEQLRDYASRHMSAEDKERVLCSRGDVRMGYLKEFLVMRLKDAGQMKREIVDEKHEHQKRDVVTHREWNSERVKKKLGPERGQALMVLPQSDPGNLKWIRCPKTR